MNHAIMGNGGPPLTDEQAEAIYQAQKYPQGAPGWYDAITAYKPKQAPEGYKPLKNPYGDGAEWPQTAPDEPDPASQWRYPGDFGWMSRDEMYSKRSAWLHARMVRRGDNS